MLIFIEMTGRGGEEVAIGEIAIYAWNGIP